MDNFTIVLIGDRHRGAALCAFDLLRTAGYLHEKERALAERYYERVLNAPDDEWKILLPEDERDTVVGLLTEAREYALSCGYDQDVPENSVPERDLANGWAGWISDTYHYKEN